MKFYEFNDYGYYALIGAESEEEAVEFYQEQVADIEEDDGPPDEITTDEAKNKFLNVCESKDLCEALDEFVKYSKQDEPYLVLIDGSLI